MGPYTRSAQIRGLGLPFCPWSAGLSSGERHVPLSLFVPPAHSPLSLLSLVPRRPTPADHSNGLLAFLSAQQR